MPGRFENNNLNLEANQYVLPWNEALKQRGFRRQLSLLAVSILIVVACLPYYFHSVIGPKDGIQLNDFLLNRFYPSDYSWIIFGLIYASLIITVQGIYTRPLLVVLGLKCYLVITLMRMVTMYVFTLEPPAGIIPLHDPLVDVIAYGGEVFNKDLFFSGHVATLTLFVLLEERPFVRRFVVINTLLVAAMILLQRVHYTIDVLAAPLAMMGVYQFLKNRK